MLRLLLALALILSPPGAARRTPRLIEGTVALGARDEAALRLSLERWADAPSVDAFAPTDVQALGDLHLISLIGLRGLSAQGGWNLLDHGAWFGLAVLDAAGEVAFETEPAFAAMLDAHAGSFPHNGLIPSRRPTLAQTAHILPWTTGTRMFYGVAGVHANGFTGLVPGWLAVDFLSDGDSTQGHAPNRLIASAAGTVTYRCTPATGQTSSAIKIGDLMYTHLEYAGSPAVGTSIAQGAQLGTLKTGSFNENCGYATQGATWFHVHYGFPNVSAFSVGGWTLDTATQVWARGTTTRPPQSWIWADLPASRTYFLPRVAR